MKYKRNDEALREALETYHPEGMEVTVPIFGDAVIVRAIPTNPVRHVSETSMTLTSPWMSYLVKAKKPLPFAEWVRFRFKNPGRSGPHVQLTLDDWRREYGGGSRLPLMPDYLMNRLEQGGTLSFNDLEHEELQGRGCLDMDGNVTCYTFWSKDVTIKPSQLQVGSMVEHHWTERIGDSENLEFTVQGVIIHVDHARKEALLELFTPTPYLLCPNAIDNTRLKPSFYVEGTYALSYGTYEAFEIAQEESGEKLIPEGKWDDHQRLYTLKEFLPLSVIEGLCREAYKDESHCILQSLILYVVPVHLELEDKTYQGTWRPLVKNDVAPDAVISYDFDEE